MEQQIVPVQYKRIAIVSVINHGKCAQDVDAVAVAEACRHHINEHQKADRIKLHNLSDQAKGDSYNVRICNVEYLPKIKYFVCQDTPKSKLAMVGLSQNWSCKDSFPQTLFCPLAEFCRERDASPKGHDCGPAKSYRGMIEDRQRRVGVRRNRQRFITMDIQDRQSQASQFACVSLEKSRRKMRCS